ncbi:MAG TPA: protein phosphatase CheZ [Thermodesulfovibrionales bacterium]|nr:protein phosphatase CheZ [Thermodesulfovibrionales bacterium]
MEQYIGFHLNASEYTIPILKVREIVSMPAITRMPQAPEYIEGVTNLRGSVIPIVNLKKLVNLGDNGNRGNKIIVVASGRMTFGILVDGITGVINIDESSIEHPKKFLNDNVEQIEGVAKLEDRLVVLLDTKKLLPSEDMSLFEDVVIDVKETDGSDRVEVVKTVQTMAGEIKVKELHDARDFFEKRGIDSSDPRYVIFDDLVSFIEAVGNSDYEKADHAMENILKKGQSGIFNEVGRVTRKLHDSIKSFKEAIDPRLKDMANVEMPGAIDRLKYVIDKTEDAANKTMGIVEKYTLGMDELSSQIRKLKEPEDAIAYLKTFKNSLEDDLTEILTTQSFQDLTGQTIKKVIKLVSEIEEELVKLIATFGVKIEHGVTAEAINPEQVSQSDVDDLLKDFGF